jgi:hypothetical protein
MLRPPEVLSGSRRPASRVEGERRHRTEGGRAGLPFIVWNVEFSAATNWRKVGAEGVPSKAIGKKAIYFETPRIP